MMEETISSAIITEFCFPRIAVGDSFDVSLESNPTTGYSWKLDFDTLTLEKILEEYIAHPTPSPDWCGGGGITKFKFKALKCSQTTTVEFSYRRPWETSVPPVKIARYSGTIDPSPFFP